MKTGRRGGIMDTSEMTMSQIDSLITSLLGEKLERAVMAGDPDVLVREALQFMFSGSGEPGPPREVSPGIIAVPGIVRDKTGGRHDCKLYTVRFPDGESEVWSWDETLGTLIHGDSNKVGDLRRSVNLHVAVDGMVIIQHVMTHDGTRHSRRGCTAFRVSQSHDEKTGEALETSIALLPSWTPSHLPPPDGEQDQRSFSAKKKR